MLPQLRLRTLEANTVLGRHVCQDGQLRPGTLIQISFVMEDNQLLERWAGRDQVAQTLTHGDAGLTLEAGDIKTAETPCEELQR